MKKLMIAALAAVTVAVAMADSTGSVKDDENTWVWSPVGLGLAAPIQIPWTASNVYGLRFGGAFGMNRSVYGADFGLVNLSTYDFRGLGAGVVNWVEVDAYGAMIGAFANHVGGNAIGASFSMVGAFWGEFWGAQLDLIGYNSTFNGVQLGAILNWNSYDSAGAQLGLVNANQQKFDGFSCGVVNHAASTVGCQLGVFNTAYEMKGLQLGAFNACDVMNGVQLGVFNMITTSTVPLMILANASF